MTFLPKADLLTLEELDRLCSAFVAKGVTKLRLTGGEPLVRRGIMTLFRSLSRHLASRRAEGAHAHHQRLAAREICRRTRRTRRRAHQRLDRHARSRQVPRHHALGRSRQGAGRHRCRAGRRAEGQDQRRGAQGRQRGRDRATDRLGARARHGPDADRSDAARRDRRSPGSTSICRCRWCARGSPSATRSTTSTTAPAVLRATCACRRPAAGSASSRR